MKAVLLVDLPESCEDCPYLGHTTKDHIRACILTDGWFREDEPIEEERSVICPLRPLPKKMDIEQVGFIWGEEQRLYSIGYNTCLDEITGETTK